VILSPPRKIVRGASSFNAPYTCVPPEEVTGRIEALQENMQAEALDGCLLLQNIDIFYFSGTMQDGILFIPAQGNPTFWVRRSLERGRAESPLRDLRPQETLKQICQKLKARLSPKTVLGLELDILPINIFQRCADQLPDVALTDISPLIRNLRSCKSDYELQCIQKACRISSEVFAAAKALIKPGMSELELQAELEYQARIRGHLGIGRMRSWNNELFFGHVISGPAAAVRGYMDAPTNGIGLNPAFPQGATIQPLQPGIPVSIDFMINYYGYLSDATRMFCLGEPDKKLERAHHDLLELNRQLLDAVKPGIEAGSLYELATELADTMKYGEHFLGFGSDRVSFIGHGIGLEVDEFPFLARGSRQLLKEGMVFALEPKFIFPGLGVATIENTCLVTKNGVERLTKDNEKIIVV
jgi:Xaa-Pro dipeptidase